MNNTLKLFASSALIVGMCSLDSAMAMEDDAFGFLDRTVKSAREVEDEKLQLTIAEFSPKYVQPFFWQYVEVLEPSIAWKKWIESDEPKDPCFHDKWSIPNYADSAINWLIGPSPYDVVSFHSYNTKIMFRQDANKIMRHENKIMRHENETLAYERAKIYSLEFPKLDYASAKYDGMTWDKRNTLAEPHHPDVINLWRTADKEKKLLDYKNSPAGREAEASRIRAAREVEARRIRAAREAEASRIRQEKFYNSVLQEIEYNKKLKEEELRKAYIAWRAGEMDSGDFNRISRVRSWGF